MLNTLHQSFAGQEQRRKMAGTLSPMVCALCMAVPPVFAQSHQEVDGIVVFEAEDYHDKRGEWLVRDGLSGSAMMHNDGCERGKSGHFLMYNIHFSTTGTYFLWFLGKAGSPASIDADDLKIWFDTPSKAVTGQENSGRDFEISMYHSDENWPNADAAPYYQHVYGPARGDWGWSNNAKDKSGTYDKRIEGLALSAQWEISRTGIHTMHVVKGHEPEHCIDETYGFDKVVLVKDGTHPPAGVGPPQVAYWHSTKPVSSGTPRRHAPSLQKNGTIQKRVDLLKRNGITIHSGSARYSISGKRIPRHANRD